MNANERRALLTGNAPATHICKNLITLFHQCLDVTTVVTQGLMHAIQVFGESRVTELLLPQ